MAGPCPETALHGPGRKPNSHRTLENARIHRPTFSLKASIILLLDNQDKLRTLGNVGLIGLVFRDDLLHPILIKVREKDFVQAWIPLLIVQELRARE